ncbi:hypothetical protein WG70_28250 [Burkholderia oklahomensis EO147]|nr:hypothetical protein WG70_28250 [Burkholderia oklahomensis EO147]KUY64736.1 hypothetical protein WG70_29540 [Burkholderia oklahomensis EO147]
MPFARPFASGANGRDARAARKSKRDGNAGAGAPDEARSAPGTAAPPGALADHGNRARRGALPRRERSSGSTKWVKIGAVSASRW